MTPMRFGSICHFLRITPHRRDGLLSILQRPGALVLHVLVAGRSILHDERRDAHVIEGTRHVVTFFQNRRAPIAAARQDDDGGLASDPASPADTP